MKISAAKLHKAIKMLIKTKKMAFKLRFLDFPPSSALAYEKRYILLPLTVHPALFFMPAPHDTSAPVLPFSPEFPLQSVCILLPSFQPLALPLILPSCRGHAHCHSPWSCVHHNRLYSKLNRKRVTDASMRRYICSKSCELLRDKMLVSFMSAL